MEVECMLRLVTLHQWWMWNAGMSDCFVVLWVIIWVNDGFIREELLFFFVIELS